MITDMNKFKVGKMLEQEEYYKSPKVNKEMVENLNNRLYYSNGCIAVSSIKACDREGWETAILLEDSYKAIVVEAYKTEEDMKQGHYFWVNMLESSRLRNIYELKDVIKFDYNTFKTYLPKNYSELVKWNKEPQKVK